MSDICANLIVRDKAVIECQKDEKGRTMMSYKNRLRALREDKD